MSELYEKALDEIAPHCKGGDSKEQTLNRLFLKHLTNSKQHLLDGAPVLSLRNVAAKELSKSKLEWAKLADMDVKKRAYDYGGHIVIVRFRGEDCLIDGHHRCRHWVKHEDKGVHTAFVLEVAE
jgi:hypothetical protein